MAIFENFGSTYVSIYILGKLIIITHCGETMFNELFEILLDRKTNPRPGSYTNKLLDANEDLILQKVG